MRKLLLSTDQVCDLPEEYIKEHNIVIVPLTYSVNGVDYDNINNKQLPSKELFELMRQGHMPKTSQPTPELVKELFVKYINEGYDIFNLATSSGISGTSNSVRLAVEEIKENKDTLITKGNKDFKLVTIDSLTGSAGEGMLMSKLVTLRNEGATIEKIEEVVKQLAPKVCHYFILDDLHYLAKGGRISNVKAIVGSMLQIKPVMHMNEEGKLLQIGKAMGRKKAIKALVDRMKDKIDKAINDVIYICHGDCIEDANFLKKLIERTFDIKEFVITNINPIVGAHGGPSALGLFFYGIDRLEKAV